MIRLKIENLHFRNNGPIHLNVNAGECIGISGASGIGKTLFLRAIADLDPHVGKVYLDGAAADQMKGHEWRRQVGLLPAESAWWLPSVGGHFPTFDPQALSLLGFDEEVVTWPVERLSSGERQRLALLRLLANTPRVLLLDEPTASLDEENVRRVESLISGYRSAHRAAVIWVGHQLSQLGRVASRQMCLTGRGLVEI